MKIPITEYDVIFISYDEPNADDNYADLLNKIPWAKRSHGVFGSDAAHKAAGALSETPRFIGIDADNIIDPDFLNIELDDRKVDMKVDVVSWSGKNTVNGLVYGNGGIKCWPLDVVENMFTHENANTSAGQVDFCWDIHYVQMNNVYSNVHNNASPYQAYRAGFREGCKMCLDNGDVVPIDRFKQRIHWKNYKRLLVWMSVGADTLNGWWAMYGARLGCWMTNFERNSWNWVDVRDFEWHTRFWNETIVPQFETEIGATCTYTGWTYDLEKLIAETCRIGGDLRSELNLEIADLDDVGSRFFKETYINPSRTAPLIRESQVDDQY
jgi:hypothetical protein